MKAAQTRATIYAAALSIAILTVAHGAEAQPANCGPRAQITSHLAEHYLERPVAHGLSTDGLVLEVLASKSGATWTIVVTRTDGIACLIAAGEHWTTYSGTAPNKLERGR